MRATAYYRLSKPGIVYGNALTTVAGFLFASRWHFAPELFFATLFGIMFVVASACVFNNYFDRDIDAKMARTKERALATGEISYLSANLYAAVIGILGLALLYIYANPLTTAVAFVGFILYVFVYTFAKRHTHWATVIGSVPGAIPVVVGYTAVTDRVDAAAFILFLTLALWQMPHFYAIAIRRKDEYAAAGIPVLPLVKGVRAVKVQILGYIVAFMVVAMSLWWFGYTNNLYLGIVLLLEGGWLWVALKGDARRTFLMSLVVLVGWCVGLLLGTLF